MNTTTTAPMPRTRPHLPRPLALLGATMIILVGSYALADLRPATMSPTKPVPAPTIVAPGGLSAVDSGGIPAVSLGQIDHSIQAWSKNLAADPKDYLSATNLAILYQGRGRLSYDLADHQRALTAAQTALEIEPRHAPARAIRAAILFTLHDFTGAFAAADALVQDDPLQLGGLATRFDAEIELGRMDDARADLRRLTVVGGPAMLIRQARFESVTGDTTAALASAEQARATALDDDTADLGFYAFAAGEYARLAGDATTARARYREALDARSTDLAALVGLARIDAFQGRTDAAIAGLQRATGIAPQPEALALLGDLQAETGDPTASKAYDTVRFIERLGDIQATTFDRQLLRFELDHGGATDEVLARARTSLDGRPDWTGHDTVAWALYRLGRFDDAATEISAARVLGADDARLRFHDGAIALARGDIESGSTLIRAALDLGPALDPVEREEATRLLGR